MWWVCLAFPLDREKVCILKRSTLREELVKKNESKNGSSNCNKTSSDGLCLLQFLSLDLAFCMNAK